MVKAKKTNLSWWEKNQRRGIKGGVQMKAWSQKHGASIGTEGKTDNMNTNIGGE